MTKQSHDTNLKTPNYNQKYLKYNLIRPDKNYFRHVNKIKNKIKWV
jgi:hypothetical protein